MFEPRTVPVPGKSGTTPLRKSGIDLLTVVVVDERKLVLGGDVVVDARGIEVARIGAVWLIGDVVGVVVVSRSVGFDNAAGRRQLRLQRVGLGQQRIRRRLIARRGTEREQIGVVNDAGGVGVSEDPARGAGSEIGLTVHVGAGEAVDLGVTEEEQLVLDNGPADVAAALIEFYDVARKTDIVVVVVIGVEIGITVLPEYAAVNLIGAGLGDEFDLRAALPGVVHAGRRGGHRNFFKSIDRGVNIAEVAVARFQVVVLRVHAVDGDVDGPLGQAVDGRTARRGWSGGSGRIDKEI